MVYVFLANGFEELEALAPVDILRRGGVSVLTVGVGGKTIFGAHNIPVVCEKCVDEIKIQKGDAIVLPGGMPGTVNLENNKTLSGIIDFCAQNEMIMGAICAAPSILGHKGVLKGKRATCFSGFEKDLEGAFCENTPVVADGNIITAFGAGAAFQFGYALLGALTDSETAEKVRKSMRFGE